MSIDMKKFSSLEAEHGNVAAGYQEHPILFSTAMARAILDGRKTQTRRVLKKPHENVFEHFINGFWPYFYNGKGNLERRECPYGKPGDQLWVRETWNQLALAGFVYKADLNPRHKDIRWKPSVFMPRKACRLLLRVTSVRVERLQSLSQEDAIAEGIEMTWINDDPQECRFKNYINDGTGSLQPCQSYRSLWKSINGADSWDLNPWVWVIEFERCQ